MALAHIDRDGKKTKIWVLPDARVSKKYDHVRDRWEFKIYHPWYTNFPFDSKVNIMEVICILDTKTGELWECRVTELGDRTIKEDAYIIALEVRHFKQ